MGVTCPTSSPLKSDPLRPWQRAQYSAYTTPPRADRDVSMGYGHGGGVLVRMKFSMRRTEGRSSVGGSAPVPKAALRLRSSTELLLPSQCSHMPVRLP